MPQNWRGQRRLLIQPVKHGGDQCRSCGTSIWRPGQDKQQDERGCSGAKSRETAVKLDATLPFIAEASFQNILEKGPFASFCYSQFGRKHLFNSCQVRKKSWCSFSFLSTRVINAQPVMGATISQLTHPLIGQPIKWQWIPWASKALWPNIESSALKNTLRRRKKKDKAQWHFFKIKRQAGCVQPYTKTYWDVVTKIEQNSQKMAPMIKKNVQDLVNQYATNGSKSKIYFYSADIELGSC